MSANSNETTQITSNESAGAVVMHRENYANHVAASATTALYNAYKIGNLHFSLSLRINGIVDENVLVAVAVVFAKVPNNEKATA